MHRRVPTKKILTPPSKFRCSQLACCYNISLFGDCSCTVTVNGVHEPNVIMKDNDLKYKIRLPRPLAKSLMTQIENDANFLYNIGVMDYSLLVGVHNTQYAVKDDEEDGRLSTPTSPMSQMSPTSLASRFRSKTATTDENTEVVNPLNNGGSSVFASGNNVTSRGAKSKRMEVGAGGFSAFPIDLFAGLNLALDCVSGESSGGPTVLYHGHHRLSTTMEYQEEGIC
jgi:hypothetical protein